MTEHSVTHTVSGLTGDLPRLDVFITDELGLFPRSQLKQRLVRLTLNGQPVKPGKKVKNGDRIDIVYSDPPEPFLEPEPMALDILYEDDDVIVVNKPRGLVVHPGAGHRTHTLANGLLAHCAGLSEAFSGAPLRPGIVHRLDKETTGVIIAAKHPAALEYLARQFRRRRARKLYLALVAGRPEERSGRIDTYIARDRVHRQRFIALSGADGRPALIIRDEHGEIPEGTYRARGKRAVTEYRVLRDYAAGTLVALKPRTGRTHQLRVHMKHLACPIVGDALYARGKTASGPLMLHAWKLKVRLPADGRSRIFKAEPPADFKSRLKRNGPGDKAR
jgi:23S rRNA pseudouridine1911/1915/1917 synthase